jgi:hypothetical protein
VHTDPPDTSVHIPPGDGGPTTAVAAVSNVAGPPTKASKNGDDTSFRQAHCEVDQPMTWPHGVVEVVNVLYLM